ncbi:MAG: HAMP domain-containing protein [Synechococcaceae cyanobacterium SM2_3_1]|nr:HAMP domain-containing protein [Synechococcaceae cyanobacterium SM2_3_1]
MRVQTTLNEPFEKFITKLSQTQPATVFQLQDMIDNFFQEELPEDDVFLIAVIHEEFYASSPIALPTPLRPDSAIFRQLIDLTVSEQEMLHTWESDIGGIITLSKAIHIQEERVGMMVLAHTTAGEQAEVEVAMFVLLKVLLAMFPVALLLGWIGSGRILEPLRVLAATAERISDKDLNQRISSQGRGEMAEVVRAFNNMLERLEKAFQSQRRFIDDASHELRTPITIIQGHIDLMGSDPEEQQEVLALVQDELNRMDRLVSDLLTLAQLNRSSFLKVTSVEISILTLELFHKAKVLGAQHWHLASSAKGTIWLDRHLFTQAVINLARNAAQHTPDGQDIILGSEIENHEFAFGFETPDQGFPKPNNS